MCCLDTTKTQNTWLTIKFDNLFRSLWTNDMRADMNSTYGSYGNMMNFAQVYWTFWGHPSGSTDHTESSTPGEIWQRRSRLAVQEWGCSSITMWASGLLAASYSPDRQPHTGPCIPFIRKRGVASITIRPVRGRAAGWHRVSLPETAIWKSNQTRSHYIPSCS